MPRAHRAHWRVVAVLAALAVVAAGCGKSKKAGTGATIAFVGALTGDSANLGINIRNGAKLAVDQANKQSGTKITLREFDTAGDPAQANTVKEQFINDKKILGLVGPAFSGETKAVLPALQEAGLVMISASATNPALPTVVPNGTVFHRVIPDDDVQGRGVADYITKRLKATKVALVHDNSEYGKGLWDVVLKTLSEQGIPTVTTQVIDPKGQDYSAAVNNVKAANPEVVFFGGYYDAAGRLKKQLHDAGAKGTFVSGDGSLDQGFVTSAGVPGAEGAQITCPCKLATEDAAGNVGQFAKDYKAATGKDPGTYSTEGFDAANILIKGAREGNTTRSALLDYVNRKVSAFDGVSKTISFDPKGNVTTGDVFVYEIRNGKIELLGGTSQLSAAGGVTSSTSSTARTTTTASTTSTTRATTTTTTTTTTVKSTTSTTA